MVLIQICCVQDLFTQLSAIGTSKENRSFAVPRQHGITLPILVNEVPVVVGFELKLQEISRQRACVINRHSKRQHLIHAIGHTQGARVLKSVQ